MKAVNPRSLKFSIYRYFLVNQKAQNYGYSLSSNSILYLLDVGMKATIDPIVWDYAKDNDLMIVSKDADMHDLTLV
jgi:predicted nuclease of predicted toxin-antitoxin system